MLTHLSVNEICFRCKHLPVTSGSKIGQIHSTDTCLLKAHPDANKDKAKQFSDTPAYKAFKLRDPGHQVLSPKYTAKGKGWGWDREVLRTGPTGKGQAVTKPGEGVCMSFVFSTISSDINHSDF